MGGTPYSDITAFYHGLFSLFVPLGWALILYPYWRTHRGQWIKTLIFVAVLSLSAMVAKEILLDAEISSDDIAADLLGLFFGTGLVSLILFVAKVIKGRSETAEDREPAPRQDGTAAQETLATDPPPKEISLRDIMGVLAKIHGRGGCLFEEAARNCTRQSGRELCERLAAEKRAHEREIRALLKRWTHKVPDVRILDWMDERIGRYGIFKSPPPAGVDDHELIDYAVRQESDIHKLFSSLHDHFRGYSWRTVQYENMILELKGHKKRFEDLCPKRRPDGVGSGGVTEKAEPEAPGGLPGGKSTDLRDAAVLVVDDDEGIRTAVAEYLRGDGFRHVDTARDGQEALERFEKRSYDVAIIDIAMPKRHGLEVLKGIKTIHPQSEVIIITGRGGKNSAIAALKLGAFDYIEKPFDFDVLSRSVSRGLNKKRSTKVER